MSAVRDSCSVLLLLCKTSTPQHEGMSSRSHSQGVHAPSPNAPTELGYREIYRPQRGRTRPPLTKRPKFLRSGSLLLRHRQVIRSTGAVASRKFSPKSPALCLASRISVWHKCGVHWRRVITRLHTEGFVRKAPFARCAFLRYLVWEQIVVTTRRRTTGGINVLLGDPRMIGHALT